MTPDSSSSRRGGAVVLAALGVAAVALAGVTAVRLTNGDTDTGGEGNTAPPEVLGTEAVREPDPTFDLDLGPASAADVAGCVTPAFAEDLATVEVLYGMRQRTAGDSVAVLVLRNEAGDLRLCDVNGGDNPSGDPVPSPGEGGEPVAFLSNGRASWDCAGRRIQRYADTTWLVVSGEVDRVQQRYVVDGEAGPWFSTVAQGGYAHLQTWLEGPLPRRTTVEVEQRVLDATGEPVAQSALPTGPRKLPGCRGGDVEIG